MELGLSGKKVLITGGTKGIGLQVVRDFLDEGAEVAVIASGKSTGSEFVELQQKFSTAIHFFICDITDIKKVSECLEEILQKMKGLDVVVANVGNGAGKPDAIPDMDQWNQLWDINFNSALNTARVFSEELRKSKGSLLFISSIAGVEFLGAPTGYSTAKTAVISFAKTLSYKLAPDVRVNVIAPGNIWTPGGTWDLKMRENPGKVENMLNEKVPLKRLGQVSEISAAVLFLSSEKASFITGSCVIIDGGQTTGF